MAREVCSGGGRVRSGATQATPGGNAYAGGMKIAIGSDHAAYELRQSVMKHLADAGHEVLDLGCPTPERADYPVFGAAVGNAVVNGEAELGVALCGTGVGISISANKIHGVRACCCSEPYSARMSRQHNNANVLCLGARVVGDELANMIVDEFLAGEFLGGRHAQRVAMITELDDER